MAARKTSRRNLGKSRKIDFEVADYYILILGLTFKKMYETIGQRRLNDEGRWIDARSIPKALRRGTICPLFYAYILEYLQEEVAKARSKNIIDLEYIPVPLSLGSWPNEATKKMYKKMMRDNK